MRERRFLLLVFALLAAVGGGDAIAQSVAYVAVGPEGGFSERELRTAKSIGWQPVLLGPRTLRIETACAVLATLVSSDLHAS